MIRPAQISDVSPIVALVNSYVTQGDLLPRSREQVIQTIRDWYVADIEGQVVACGALVIIWDDLAEVRSLAVRTGFQGQGLGRHIVEKLLDEARQLGISRVFALTRAVGFFTGLGFQITPKETLPRKIWRDCIHCLKFPACDETAVILQVFPEIHLNGEGSSVHAGSES
ncbi:MAG: N-acetyltransferase [Chloroflexi bacterium]|nr:N-acetyltransferase [Chloroflexota bacterium]